GGGSCTIWPHREATCSTWYCKFNSPVKGRDFWANLKALLYPIEVTVAVHCALENGIAGNVVDALNTLDTTMKTPQDVDAKPDDELLARLWGSWLGREEEYYQECAKLAEKLDLDAIRKLGGVTLQRRLDAAIKSYEALMNHALPARLRAAASLAVSPAG